MYVTWYQTSIGDGAARDKISEISKISRTYNFKMIKTGDSLVSKHVNIYIIQTSQVKVY